MRIAELNFCDLGVNFLRTLCFSMEVLLFMKFIFFGAIRFNGNVFGLWIVGDEFSHHTVGVPLLAVNSVCCATCVVFTQLDSLTFLGLFIYFYFFYYIFLQLFELI